MNPIYLPLFEFIYDRQLIYHKKEVLKQPPPWTDDPVLKKHLFCNVTRDQDSTTVYLKNHLEKIDNQIDKIWNIVLYRFFNKKETMEELVKAFGIPTMEGYNIWEYEKVLDEVLKTKKPIFNPAYLIQGGYPCKKDYRPRDKHSQVLWGFVYWRKALKKEDWMSGLTDKSEECLKHLESIYKVGPFLASQLLDDICSFTNIVNFTNNDWISPGPGTSMGIEDLKGNEIGYEEIFSINKEIKKEHIKICYELRDEQELYFKELKERTGKDWWKITEGIPKDNWPYLPLQSGISHVLCEYRKAFRWGQNKGRKRYYRGK